LCEDSKKGIYHPSPFVATLKDERRPIWKIEKTRVFTAGNKAFTIFFRQHLLDAMVMLSANRFKLGHCVGLNPHGNEWAMMLNFLAENVEPGTNMHIVAADYSKFDGMLDASVFRELVMSLEDAMVYHGMSKDHHGCFKSIVEDLTHAHVVVFDGMYQLLRGEPSGSPGTAPLNTEMNKWMLALAFLEVMREQKPDEATLSTFKHKVRIIAYGDDFVMNVSDSISQYFNMVTLEAYYRKHHITITEPSKVAREMRAFMPLDEVTFLKRYFRSVEGRITAPMDDKDRLEIINWMRTGSGMLDEDITRQNVEVVLREGVHQGRVKFNEDKRILNGLLGRNGIATLDLFYDDLLINNGLHLF